MWNKEELETIAVGLPDWTATLRGEDPNTIRLQSRDDPDAVFNLWWEQHSPWVHGFGDFPSCWNGCKPRLKSRRRPDLDKLIDSLRRTHLPRYLDILRQARNFAAAFAANQRRCAETCARLAAMIPDKESFSEFSVRSGLSRPDGQGVEMFVGNDVFGNVVVGMRLLRLSGDQAAAILRILFPE